MINYSLIQEDKSQLNKNNTGLHAAKGAEHKTEFLYLNNKYVKVSISICF